MEQSETKLWHEIKLLDVVILRFQAQVNELKTERAERFSKVRELHKRKNG
jgi:hypothetical protein